MRGKIRFPKRAKPVEREVHHDAGGHYIVSKGNNVPVTQEADGTWSLDPKWIHIYEGR